jgi:hypothetical protein
MRMNTALLFSFVFSVLIVFSIDPDTSLVADNTYKLNYRDVAALSDDKINKDKSNDKQNGQHLCPKCESRFLTFQPIDANAGSHIGKEGQSVQSIKCRDCGFHWKETWTLSSWIWLKSSSQDNNGDSERWNIKLMDSDIRDLKLAQGIKDSLKEAGFDTLDDILKDDSSDISNKLGIDPYVAQIIKDAAKRAIEGGSEKETI